MAITAEDGEDQHDKHEQAPQFRTPGHPGRVAHLRHNRPGAHHPARSALLGMALTASSLVIMPVLGMAKRRLGARLGSGATAGEGTQNLMCAAQAAGVLLALVVVAAWPGAWPVDPIIALGVAAWSAWEGHRSWRGADCC